MRDERRLDDLLPFGKLGIRLFSSVEANPDDTHRAIADIYEADMRRSVLAEIGVADQGLRRHRTNFITLGKGGCGKQQQNRQRYAAEHGHLL